MERKPPRVCACLFCSDYRKCKKLSGSLKRMALSVVFASRVYCISHNKTRLNVRRACVQLIMSNTITL